MPLKIIGTGQGRTGTTSLKLALEQLGFGKCYHMFELLETPEQISYFKKAENGEPVDWDTLFTGYVSAVDYPVVRYYKQLLAAYPEAMVIHTTRDPESWYNSALKTIFWASKPTLGNMLMMMIRAPFSSIIRRRLPVLKFNGKLVDTIYGKDLQNKAAVIEKFNAFNTEVLNTVPKNRLLVYDVKQGWAPLCNFLHVPIPPEPFPQSNSTDDFLVHVGGLLKGK